MLSVRFLQIAQECVSNSREEERPARKGFVGHAERLEGLTPM